MGQMRNKNPVKHGLTGFYESSWGAVYGGEAGIRTLGRLLTYAGFQDRYIQPALSPLQRRAILLNNATVDNKKPRYIAVSRFFLKSVFSY